MKDESEKTFVQFDLSIHCNLTCLRSIQEDNSAVHTPQLKVETVQQTSCTGLSSVQNQWTENPKTLNSITKRRV